MTRAGARQLLAAHPREGDASLPEGTRVTVIPERPGRDVRLLDWLREARELRAQLPFTSDSVECPPHG